MNLKRTNGPSIFFVLLFMINVLISFPLSATENGKKDLILETKANLEKIVQQVSEIKASLKLNSKNIYSLRDFFKDKMNDSSQLNIHMVNEIVDKYVDSSSGMMLNKLSEKWQQRNELQTKIMDKIEEMVEIKTQELIQSLRNLKQISRQVESIHHFINDKLDILSKYQSSIPFSSVVVGPMINQLKLISDNIEKDILIQLSKQQNIAEKMQDIFEVVIRSKWSLKYDSKKVIDRFFIPNSPLENSIYLLNSNTYGIIKAIKTQKIDTNEKKDQTFYYLLVSFDLCNNMDKEVTKDTCKTKEDLWIEYNPELNQSLDKYDNLSGLSTAESQQEQQPISIVELDSRSLPIKQVSVPVLGAQVRIGVDGVNAFERNPLGDSEDSVESSDYDKSASMNSPRLFNSDEINQVDDSNQSQSVQRDVAVNMIPTKSAAAGLIMASQGFANSCQEYIRMDGQFGSIGKAILKSIGEHNVPHLFADDIGDLKPAPKRICPNYENFTPDEKSDFIVYYATVIGMAESSCVSRQKAKGPNGTLVGQWQLHLGKTHLYAGGVCKKINPLIGEQNVVCGLKMLNYYTGLDENRKKELFYSKNYWETMHYPRPSAKKALKLIHKFTKCFE